MAPSRRRGSNDAAQDVDASILQLGPEFTEDLNSDERLIALNLSEARLLMIEAMRQRKNEAAMQNADVNGDSFYEKMELDDPELLSSNPIVSKTQEYLSTFARFRDEETVNAVEHLLKSPENSTLHPFELAQLGSLSFGDAEEARYMIPSLNGKKSDDDLQTLVDNLRRFEK
ncbi:HRDC-like protein [Lipomyces oligophaga]|uniref:HRDC-like protein n=1 Tax=Lipomyces oligophaga TaxID=45792 RepID=UPI0034CE0DB6